MPFVQCGEGCASSSPPEPSRYTEYPGERAPDHARERAGNGGSEHGGAHENDGCTGAHERNGRGGEPDSNEDGTYYENGRAPEEPAPVRHAAGLLPVGDSGHRGDADGSPGWANRPK